ncbi:hypothetical protein NBRC116592_08340 [Colwellia sp. KU-HH00111]|uniref:hypothetical protein n=1 Tax=Colwellia sp. KU-HH00111 TaxID=3127652 RepID=UPI003108189C
MQFLKSLFCLLGFDNRSRFFAICASVYAIFIMLVSAFTSQLVVAVFITLLFTVVLALTNLRRLHDAELNKNWLFVPSIAFITVALIIIFAEQYSSYALFIIPALCSAVLLTYPSRKSRSFILGYYGPVNMQEYQVEAHLGKAAKFRIEPRLVGDNHLSTDSLTNVEQPSVFQEHVQENSRYSSNTTHHDQTLDVGEMIRIKILSNNKLKWGCGLLIVLTLLGLLTVWLVNFLNASSSDLSQEKTNQIVNKTVPKLDRYYPLAMPDNYTLYLSEHRGITINWQADEVNTALLWSQETAKGDGSCKEISFNKGVSIRTLMVQVETNSGANTDYFASFSPLDSKTLIKALAFGSKFSLCGYQFSLKGSQAAIAINDQYASWLEY